MKTIVKVLMLAFGDPGQIREVTIPQRGPFMIGQALDVLETVFELGQNDFVPQRCPSVSVGDVAMLPIMDPDTGRFEDRPFIVQAVGWQPITTLALALYCQLPRRDRAWSLYARPEVDETPAIEAESKEPLKLEGPK